MEKGNYGKMSGMETFRPRLMCLLGNFARMLFLPNMVNTKGRWKWKAYAICVDLPLEPAIMQLLHAHRRGI
jgi:hypothetical protein